MMVAHLQIGRQKVKWFVPNFHYIMNSMYSDNFLIQPKPLYWKTQDDNYSGIYNVDM